MFYSMVYNHIFLPSFMAVIVVFLILSIKFILKRQLTAEIHYYIWFLLLLRLIIPYSVQTSFSVYNYIKMPYENEIVQITNVKADNSDKSTVNTSLINNTDNIRNIAKNTPDNNYQQVQNNQSLNIISLVWLIGAISIFIYVIIVNINMKKLLNASHLFKSERLNLLLDECKKTMKIKAKIDILAAKAEYNPPSMWGICNPKIIIPANIMEKLNDVGLKYIILHELAHYKRKDNIINIFIVFIKIINWFNPIIWYAFYLMMGDCEIACDAMVLKKLKKKEKIEYGNTLIEVCKLNYVHHSFAENTFIKNKKEIIRRVKMITLFKKKPFIWSVIAIVVIASVGIVTLTTAKKSVNNQSTEKKTTTSINKTDTNPVPTGVSNVSSVSNASNTSNTSTADNISNTTDSSTANTASKSNSAANTTTKTAPESKNLNNTQIKAEVYISKNFGLKMTFPEDWIGKYTVKEINNGILVCFKAKNMPANCQGILFEIIKKTPETNEDIIDTIGGVPRYITAGNTKFVIGRTTGIDFPDSSNEFNDYLAMEKKVSEVINTLQSIK